MSVVLNYRHRLRLGPALAPALPPVVDEDPLYDSILLGSRTYELSNHLGNVLSAISDKKIGNDSSGVVNYYIAEVLSQNDYYPFGMLQPGRSYSAGSGYRYGFNGKEMDNEVKGQGNSLDFGARIYDSRIVKWLSSDPVIKANESPYASNANNPIWIMDPDGKDSIFYNMDGTEARRIKKAGDHTYFLKHPDGNHTIDHDKYFQGNSYYSFFGDPQLLSAPNPFSTVEKEKFAKLDKATLTQLILIKYKGEGYNTIWWNSGSSGTFDYKNIKYFNDNPKEPGKGASNFTTSYLIDGILYNRNEMGMLLWGATMGMTDVGYTGLYIDNKVAHNIIEGDDDELNEMNCWRKGFLIMRDSKDIDKYTNTFMYGAFGIHYDSKVQGVDPTAKGGIHYDNWKILGHNKPFGNYFNEWRPY